MQVRPIRGPRGSGVGTLEDEEETPHGGTAAPLVVTAELPAPLQARADGLRRAHFPPERNHLAAQGGQRALFFSQQRLQPLFAFVRQL